MVVRNEQVTLDSSVFSNITLSYNSGNHVQWQNQYQTGPYTPVVSGGYTGRAFYLRFDNEGSGTLTFSYTYGGVTTSQSFNYIIIYEEYVPPPFPWWTKENEE